jgi:predicted secreted Zn-dependent protease
LILVCLIVVIALVALGGATGQEIAALLGGATPTWEQTKPSLTPTLTQTLPVKLPAAATLAGTLTITASPTPLPTHTLLPTWTPLPTSTPRPTDPPTISAPPTASSDDIDVQYETEYYIFGGTTTADIQNAINTQGPIDNNGQRAIALTSSNIGVSWRMAQSTAGCQLQEVEVKVDITFLYPQWQPETTPDPALLAEWDRFIQHVEAHEQHHAEISLECSEDLLARVQALSQTDSCAVFEANVRAINDQVTEECDARQQAYDDVEGYASFPLP